MDEVSFMIVKNIYDKSTICVDKVGNDCYSAPFI